jgi:hypothetical protein
MPINYQNGVIYSIRSHQTTNVYIGSTTQTLAQRLSKHMSGYKAYLVNGKRYTSSYEIIKYGDSYIELIEECKCPNKMELCKREGYYIRTERCVNKNIMGRTMKQYRTDNADTIKQYRTDNADTIKQYRADNADTIKEQRKQYRADNADTIKEQRNKKYNCQCGSSYTKQNRSRHLKSLKHQEYQTIIEFILS